MFGAAEPRRKKRRKIESDDEGENAGEAEPGTNSANSAATQQAATQDHPAAVETHPVGVCARCMQRRYVLDNQESRLFWRSVARHFSTKTTENNGLWTCNTGRPEGDVVDYCLFFLCTSDRHAAYADLTKKRHRAWRFCGDSHGTRSNWYNVLSNTGNFSKYHKLQRRIAFGIAAMPLVAYKPNPRLTLDWEAEWDCSSAKGSEKFLCGLSNERSIQCENCTKHRIFDAAEKEDDWSLVSRRNFQQAPSEPIMPFFYLSEEDQITKEAADSGKFTGSGQWRCGVRVEKRASGLKQAPELDYITKWRFYTRPDYYKVNIRDRDFSFCSLVLCAKCRQWRLIDEGGWYYMIVKELARQGKVPGPNIDEQLVGHKDDLWTCPYGTCEYKNGEHDGIAQLDMPLIGFAELSCEERRTVVCTNTECSAHRSVPLGLSRKLKTEKIAFKCMFVLLPCEGAEVKLDKDYEHVDGEIVEKDDDFSETKQVVTVEEAAAAPITFNTNNIVPAAPLPANAELRVFAERWGAETVARVQALVDQFSTKLSVGEYAAFCFWHLIHTTVEVWVSVANEVQTKQQAVAGEWMYAPPSLVPVVGTGRAASMQQTVGSVFEVECTVRSIISAVSDRQASKLRVALQRLIDMGVLDSHNLSYSALEGAVKAMPTIKDGSASDVIRRFARRAGYDKTVRSLIKSVASVEHEFDLESDVVASNFILQLARAFVERGGLVNSATDVEDGTGIKKKGADRSGLDEKINTEIATALVTYVAGDVIGPLVLIALVATKYDKGYFDSIEEAASKAADSKAIVESVLLLYSNLAATKVRIRATARAMRAASKCKGKPSEEPRAPEAEARLKTSIRSELSAVVETLEWGTGAGEATTIAALHRAVRSLDETGWAERITRALDVARREGRSALKSAKESAQLTIQEISGALRKLKMEPTGSIWTYIPSAASVGQTDEDVKAAVEIAKIDESVMRLYDGRARAYNDGDHEVDEHASQEVRDLGENTRGKIRVKLLSRALWSKDVRIMKRELREAKADATAAHVIVRLSDRIGKEIAAQADDAYEEFLDKVRARSQKGPMEWIKALLDPVKTDLGRWENDALAALGSGTSIAEKWLAMMLARDFIGTRCVRFFCTVGGLEPYEEGEEGEGEGEEDDEGEEGEEGEEEDEVETTAEAARESLRISRKLATFQPSRLGEFKRSEWKRTSGLGALRENWELYVTDSDSHLMFHWPNDASVALVDQYARALLMAREESGSLYDVSSRIAERYKAYLDSDEPEEDETGVDGASTDKLVDEVVAVLNEYGVAVPRWFELLHETGDAARDLRATMLDAMNAKPASLVWAAETRRILLNKSPNALVDAAHQIESNTRGARIEGLGEADLQEAFRVALPHVGSTFASEIRRTLRAHVSALPRLVDLAETKRESEPERADEDSVDASRQRVDDIQYSAGSEIAAMYGFVDADDARELGEAMKKAELGLSYEDQDAIQYETEADYINECILNLDAEMAMLIDEGEQAPVDACFKLLQDLHEMLDEHTELLSMLTPLRIVGDIASAANDVEFDDEKLARLVRESRDEIQSSGIIKDAARDTRLSSDMKLLGLDLTGRAAAAHSIRRLDVRAPPYTDYRRGLLRKTAARRAELVKAAQAVSKSSHPPPVALVYRASAPKGINMNTPGFVTKESMQSLGALYYMYEFLRDKMPAGLKKKAKVPSFDAVLYEHYMIKDLFNCKIKVTAAVDASALLMFCDDRILKVKIPKRNGPPVPDEQALAPMSHKQTCVQKGLRVLRDRLLLSGSVYETPESVEPSADRRREADAYVRGRLSEMPAAKDASLYTHTCAAPAPKTNTYRRFAADISAVVDNILSGAWLDDAAYAMGLYIWQSRDMPDWTENEKLILKGTSLATMRGGIVAQNVRELAAFIRRHSPLIVTILDADATSGINPRPDVGEASGASGCVSTSFGMPPKQLSKAEMKAAMAKKAPKAIRAIRKPQGERASNQEALTKRKLRIDTSNYKKLLVPCVIKAISLIRLITGASKTSIYDGAKEAAEQEHAVERALEPALRVTDDDRAYFYSKLPLRGAYYSIGFLGFLGTKHFENLGYPELPLPATTPLDERARAFIEGVAKAAGAAHENIKELTQGLLRSLRTALLDASPELAFQAARMVLFFRDSQAGGARELCAVEPRELFEVDEWGAITSLPLSSEQGHSAPSAFGLSARRSLFV